MSNDFPEIADFTEFQMFWQVIRVEFAAVKGCSGCEMRITLRRNHRSIETWKPDLIASQPLAPGITWASQLDSIS